MDHNRDGIGHCENVGLNTALEKHYEATATSSSQIVISDEKHTENPCRSLTEILGAASERAVDVNGPTGELELIFG